MKDLAGKTAFVTCFSLSGAVTVSPIATATNLPGKPVKVGEVQTGTGSANSA